MKASEARIRRVERYENSFDSITEAVRNLSHALDGFEDIQSGIEALEKYYTGGQWLKDFEADEKGLFPPDMKRGVLSEDAVSDLLDEIKKLKARCSSLGEK